MDGLEIFGLIVVGFIGLLWLWAVIAIVGRPGIVFKWLGGFVLFAVVFATLYGRFHV